LSLVRKSRGPRFCRLFNLRASLLGIDARIEHLPDENVFLARSGPYELRFRHEAQAYYACKRGIARRLELLGDTYFLPLIDFRPGDRVFGGRSGAFGEYLTVAADGPLVKMPAGLRFEQAAALPIAALTALQALRDKGQLQPGHKVLVNGASGGVGSFAVQLAKASGAEVTGVCSTRNVELVRALGADHVIDYKKQSYVEGGQRYDLVVDLVGNHSISANRGVLTDRGRYVIVGGPPGKWLGPLVRPLVATIQNLFVDQELVMLLARLDRDDLEFLAQAMAAGQVTSLIDRRFSLAEVPEAIRYSESGRARGKIIIDVRGPP